MIIIDIEASSLSGDSYPIEVAWAHIDGPVTSALIAPEPDWDDWDEIAEEIHGISRDLLMREGRPAVTVWEDLVRSTAGSILVSDAPEQDRWWLERLRPLCSEAVDMSVSDFESILLERCARSLGQAGSMARLEECRRQAEQVAPRTHRAAQDVRHLQAFARLVIDGAV